MPGQDTAQRRGASITLQDLHAPVLIGAGGIVGRRIRRAWHGAGTRHIALGRAVDMDIRWDMTEPPPPCQAAFGAGVVVLAGATPRTGGDLSANMSLARAGIAAARRWGAAHVFVMSSSGIYGATPRAAVAEDAIPAPENDYARAKLAMERATAASDVTALRLANVAGASQPFLAIEAGGEAQLHAFADEPDAPMRSFIGPIALASCLAALCDAAAKGRAFPPVLNVAARDPLPMADIFSARGIVPDRLPAPTGAVPFANLDTARLSQFWDVPVQDAHTLWSEVRETDKATA